MNTPEEAQHSQPETSPAEPADPRGQREHSPAEGSSAMSAREPGRRWTRRLAITSLLILALLFVAGGLAWAWVQNVLRSSLPQLDGTIQVKGARAEIQIERDMLGVPTIHASQVDDIAFGLGFVHAQDRYFQMDAIRRSAAGELAEITGPGANDAVLQRDRSVRVFRFRQVARKALSKLSEPDRRWLDAYVAGVNEGLRSLRKKPFEYYILGADPAPWRAEDSILAILAMYVDLQGKDYRRESALGVVRDVLPGPLAKVLCLEGSPDWDAPLVGDRISMPPLPGPEVFDLRKEPVHPRDVPPDPTPLDEMETLFAASNNWAVSGARSATGGAIVANDMHLRLGVPNTWYRASWIFPDADERKVSQVTGATLPGGPAMVIGSNGQIAWGLTNSGGNWSDLIEIDLDPHDADAYITPDGIHKFEHHPEIIKIKGRPDVILDVRTTIWGPVIDRDHKKRLRALRWVALDPEEVNLSLIRMADLHSVDEAMALAPSCGAPHVNLVVGDAQGHIGWTIMGRIPRRVGEGDSRFPLRGKDAAGTWQGYYGPDEAPRIVDPPGKIL